MSIENLYEKYLGRKADAGGLKHFQGRMAAGATLADVAKSIRESAEADAYNTKAIQAASGTYLGRSMDTAGLRHFRDAVAAGGSLGDAVIAISKSPEAQLYAQNQREATRAAERAEDAAFKQKELDIIATGNQAIIDQQRADMAQRMRIFQMQQEQARKDAERQARQMQIAAAYGEKDPADVRFSQSAAEKKKLLTAGTSGTFGRENLRIKGLNVKQSKGSSMASMASSFA